MLLCLLKFRTATWRARLPGITDWNVDQRPLLLTKIKIEMDTWIFSHIYYFLLNIVTHLCPNVNGGLIKLPLKFSYWLHSIVSCVCTVYPKKYAHGFVVLCFVVVMQSFIMKTHEVFIHIHQGCFAGTGAIVRLPQCQWSKPDGYGKISQCITTTKHSKAKTVCIFLGIYCNNLSLPQSLS